MLAFSLFSKTHPFLSCEGFKVQRWTARGPPGAKNFDFFQIKVYWLYGHFVLPHFILYCFILWDISSSGHFILRDVSFSGHFILCHFILQDISSFDYFCSNNVAAMRFRRTPRGGRYPFGFFFNIFSIFYTFFLFFCFEFFLYFFFFNNFSHFRKYFLIFRRIFYTYTWICKLWAMPTKYSLNVRLSYCCTIFFIFRQIFSYLRLCDGVGHQSNGSFLLRSSFVPIENHRRSSILSDGAHRSCR